VPHGKFFLRGAQKFFLKAVRLDGPINVSDFDHKLRALARLEELHRDHTTALVLSEEQAEAALDLAALGGLYALVELAVEPQQLLTRQGLRTAEAWIESAVHSLGGRPGLVGFLIDCPIEQDALRAHGVKRIRAALRRLVRKIRAAGFAGGIHHRIETRALALEEEDFIYSDATGLSPGELRDYLAAMHNVADARPVIIEFKGFNPGSEELVATAFGMGAAGVVAPAVPMMPPLHALALGRVPGSELHPFLAMNGNCPPAPARTPMVSIVICAYNAERTMRACLESLTKLDYADYEVIIVDDGARDRTAAIAADFPQFQLIRQPNRGLSVARNVGLNRARGELVAYTDSDCVVDPHWLTLMVRAMDERGFDACGGPNYAPHEEGRLEACCAASPGAPCQVLIGEEHAEHLAGCNMVFRKAVLAQIGGFDPQFTAAGDDVDICWRMSAAGFCIGFAPAAFVWHFRRNTVQAYYGQQRGYGRAEAMLYFKYPERFNLLGQIKWRGRIPGINRMLPGGDEKRIWWKAPAAHAQALEAPADSLIGFLPQTLEWNLAWGAALAVCAFKGVTILPALVMILTGPLWALHYARRAPLERCHDRLSSRLLIALLAYTGPMARTLRRYRTRFTMAANMGIDTPPRQRPRIDLRRRALTLSYWNDRYITRDALLADLTRLFQQLRCPVTVEPGWRDYDLEARPDPWTRVEIRSADEEHGGMKLINRVAARVRLSAAGKLALLAGVASTAACAMLGAPDATIAAAALTLAGTVCLVAETFEAGRFAYRAIEVCAQGLALTPLGAPARAARTIDASSAAPASEALAK